MKKVALFGGAGYLGTQLSAYLNLYDVTCDIFDIPKFDVTASSCWDVFRPEEYSTILFFAGMTGTERSFTEPDKFFAVNELGLLNLLSNLSSLGEKAPMVIFPSTRLVYKGANFPLCEDAPKEARTVYAANKLACEYLLQSYKMRYGLRYLVLRICVPWGSLNVDGYSYGTIGAFLKQAEEKKMITLFGDGSLRRTLTHVSDICKIVLRIIERNSVIQSGVYNVGGWDYSLAEVAKIIATKMNVQMCFIPWPEAALRVESGSTVFDSTKLNQAISFGEYIRFHV